MASKEMYSMSWCTN